MRYIIAQSAIMHEQSCSIAWPCLVLTSCLCWKSIWNEKSHIPQVTSQFVSKRLSYSGDFTVSVVPGDGSSVTNFKAAQV